KSRVGVREPLVVSLSRSAHGEPVEPRARPHQGPLSLVPRVGAGSSFDRLRMTGWWLSGHHGVTSRTLNQHWVRYVYSPTRSVQHGTDATRAPRTRLQICRFDRSHTGVVTGHRSAD